MLTRDPNRAHTCGVLRPAALGPAFLARNTVKARGPSTPGPKNRPHSPSKWILGPREIHVLSTQFPIESNSKP